MEEIYNNNNNHKLIRRIIKTIIKIIIMIIIIIRRRIKKAKQRKKYKKRFLEPKKAETEVAREEKQKEGKQRTFCRSRFLIIYSYMYKYILNCIWSEIKQTLQLHFVIHLALE